MEMSTSHFIAYTIAHWAGWLLVILGTAYAIVKHAEGDR